MEKTESVEVVTLQGAGRRLGVDARLLRAAVKAGELEAFRPGLRAWYVRWEDVVDWMRQRRVGAQS